MHNNKEINHKLKPLSAEKRIEWALENLSGDMVMSSSFGAQSAVMLHLMATVQPDIPVILVDTGYLFKETYQFIDELTERLKLNLKVYRNNISPAWQEARYGKQWDQGLNGIHKYNEFNKVIPMKNALDDLEAKTWAVGLRSSQSEERKGMELISIQDGRNKFLPILDWSNQTIHKYLKLNKLPYHPLWQQGYVSIGDKQTTRPISAEVSENETRFFGLTRECGLHVA